MPNLIPLLLVIVQSCCYASGHHRGEQDIELSSPIMKFLAKVKEDQSGECDDYYHNDALEDITPIQRLSVSIDKYIYESKETKHNNTPIENTDIASNCSVNGKEKE